MTFIKLQRIDSKGQLKETLLDTDNIARVVEKQENDTYLYDSEGNVAQTTEGATYYIVEPKVGRNTKLDKTNYDLLVAVLVK